MEYYLSFYISVALLTSASIDHGKKIILICIFEIPINNYSVPQHAENNFSTNYRQLFRRFLLQSGETTSCLLVLCFHYDDKIDFIVNL